MIEEVLEGVLFDAEAGAWYAITDKMARGGEPVRQSMKQMRGPSSACVPRRVGMSKLS